MLKAVVHKDEALDDNKQSETETADNTSLWSTVRHDMWVNGLSSRARGSFLRDAPATPITAELSQESAGINVGDAQEDQAKKNFAMLVLDVTDIDHVNLRSNER